MFLDLPPLTCVWRVLKRLLRYRKTTRPEMAAGCPERFSLQFLLWVWNYRRRTRPKIARLLERCEREAQVIWLQSQIEVKEYLRRQSDTALRNTKMKRTVVKK